MIWSAFSLPSFQEQSAFVIAKKKTNKLPLGILIEREIILVASTVTVQKYVNTYHVYVDIGVSMLTL